MKSHKNFVFDTNTLISAMLITGSVSDLALKKAFNTGIVSVSKECLDELSRVAMNKKFDKYCSFAKRQLFLLDFENASEFVEVKEKITLSRDADDDKFLSLAKAANAACIVSGDKDLLVLHPFGTIDILTSADFLKQY